MDETYGHFDDQAREFVITDPSTPWPWINYLGTEDSARKEYCTYGKK